MTTMTRLSLASVGALTGAGPHDAVQSRELVGTLAAVVVALCLLALMKHALHGRRP